MDQLQLERFVSQACAANPVLRFSTARNGFEVSSAAGPGRLSVRYDGEWIRFDYSGFQMMLMSYAVPAAAATESIVEQSLDPFTRGRAARAE